MRKPYFLALLLLTNYSYNFRDSVKPQGLDEITTEAAFLGLGLPGWHTFLTCTTKDSLLFAGLTGADRPYNVRRRRGDKSKGQDLPLPAYVAN